FRTRMVDINGGADGLIDNIGEATSILDGTAAAGAFTVFTDTTAVRAAVNFGNGGFYGSDLAFPNGALPTLADSDLTRTDYAIRATAATFIPAGDWTIAVNSDDGFRLRIPG